MILFCNCIQGHESRPHQASRRADRHTAAEQPHRVPLHGAVRQTQPVGQQAGVHQPLRQPDQERPVRRLDRLRRPRHEASRPRSPQNARR